MSPPAIGTSLDERGPFALARPRNRLANDPPYGVDVIAVDQRAGHAKRFGAAPDIASVHRLIRGELRKSVILADQQQWKLPQGGDVQRLGNDALAGRTVTEKHHGNPRSEEHTSELQSIMRISYAVFCLKKKKKTRQKEREKHNRDLQNN